MRRFMSSLREAANLLSLSAAITLALASPAARAEDAPRIEIAQGTLAGISAPNLLKFMGIRYAQAPTGKLRWMPPVSVSAGQGVVDATKPGAGCAQGKSPWGTPSSSEDCLFLNVTVPEDGSGMHFWQRKPVMVFFHGGGFTGGSGDPYVADALARENDVIVVTPNYRLGALGFLAHPALDAEGHVSGNYGLLDQQQSLKWVRDNIAAFGGDPDNVTIFGESAGGIAILAHMASPLGTGLFQKAIIESGVPADEPLQTAEEQGKALGEKVGCPADAGATAADCLRNVPIDKLLSAQATPIAVIVDGRLLPASITDALSSGQFNRVPVLYGNNQNEGNLMAAFMFDLAGGPLAARDYDKALRGIGSFIARVGFPDSAIPTIMKTYDLSKYEVPGLAAAQVITDGLVACPTYETSRAIAKFSPIFDYEMADTKAPSIVAPPVSFPHRAGHFSELQYLFDLGSLTLKGTPALSAGQQTLGRQMRAYWANFARNGNPNGKGLAKWPSFNEAKAGAVMSLNQPRSQGVTRFATDHQCGFWRTVARQ